MQHRHNYSKHIKSITGQEKLVFQPLLIKYVLEHYSFLTDKMSSETNHQEQAT